MRIDGAKETLGVYIGANFDTLVKSIDGDMFYDGNNMMKFKIVSKKLTADDDDFHLGDFTTFKSSNGYTGDFGNQYAMVIVDSDRSNPSVHRFMSYDF